MSVDPRTPVLVGVGQTEQRDADPTLAREPIDLLADAVRAADRDTHASVSLAQRADAIAVVDMLSWRYPDPGALLARRIGARPRRTITTTVGGNSPQMLLNRLAPEIAHGEIDTLVLGGAECISTRWRARRRDPKVWLAWIQADDPPCPEVIGDPRPGSSDYEMAHLATAPTQVYPLLETAVRAALGHGVGDHQLSVSVLWSRFAHVAATNPHAWSRVPYSPEEIRTVAPENRMVTFPYTKRMCANIDVDQAAAIVACSYETARRAGVPDDRVVFLLAGADAHDHWFFSERDTLCESPAIALAARAALDAAGLGLDDVARFDLYSCFPSAVQIALRSLGLRQVPDVGDRPLTVTGGLAFAGGPGNNYPSHAIAAMTEACRQHPGSVGMVSALGWYVTKHSIGLYSTTPPRSGLAVPDDRALQHQVDALPRRTPAGPWSGTATVEATSVVFERDGEPSFAIVSAITPDGRRALANTRDPGICRDMCEETWEGRPVALKTDGATNQLSAS